MGLAFFLKEDLPLQRVFLPVKICRAAMQTHKLASSSSAWKEEEGEDHLPVALYSILTNRSHH